MAGLFDSRHWISWGQSVSCTTRFILFAQHHRIHLPLEYRRIERVAGTSQKGLVSRESRPWAQKRKIIAKRGTEGNLVSFQLYKAVPYKFIIITYDFVMDSSNYLVFS